MSERTRTNLWGVGLLLALIALAFFATAEAQGQVVGGTCPPPVPEECRSLLQEACPYPAAMVTVKHQQALAALTGPWVIGKDFGAPPPGMRSEYATAEDWRRDAWTRPSREVIQSKKWCLDPRSGRCGSGGDVLAAAGLALKPMAPGSGPCWSHTGDHGSSQQAWEMVYGGVPTLGQWLQVECWSDRGGWWSSDPMVKAARRCVEGGAPLPPPAPDPQPPPPAPAPSPPPPPEPDCEPLAESRWARKCVALGHPDLEECEVWTLANSPNRAVWKLLQVVCPEEEPGPPPPDPPPVETCLKCSWDAGQEILHPGVPSTGKLTIELVCRGVECPGEGRP